MGPNTITSILIRERQRKGVNWPQGKECQQLPEAGRKRVSRGSTGQLTCGFQLSETNIGLTDCTRTHF